MNESLSTEYTTNNDTLDVHVQEIDMELSNWILENFAEEAIGSVDFSESPHANNPIATHAFLPDGSPVISAECDSSVTIPETEELQITPSHVNAQLPDLESYIVPLCSESAIVPVSEHATVATECNTSSEQINIDPLKEILDIDTIEDKSVLIAESNINHTDTGMKFLPAIDEIFAIENPGDRHYVLATTNKDKIPKFYGNRNKNFVELIDLTEDEPITETKIYNSNVNDICKNSRLSILLDILPDANIDFLRMKIDEIKSDDEFQLFVSTCLELQNYPKNTSLRNTVIRKVITRENPITVVSEQQLFTDPIDLSALGPSTSTAYSFPAPHTVTSTTNAHYRPVFSSRVGLQAPTPCVSRQHHPLYSLHEYTKKGHPTVNNKPHTVTSREDLTGPRDYPVDYSLQNVLIREVPATEAPPHYEVTPTLVDGGNNIRMKLTRVDPRIHLPVNNRRATGHFDNGLYHALYEDAGIIPHWIGIPRRREPRLRDLRRRMLWRIPRNLAGAAFAADAEAFPEILEETGNNVNNSVSSTSNPPTIEEQRFNLLAGILFCADREFLRKEVNKMKNDEDVEKFLVESILNEKMWSRYVSDQSNVDTSPKTPSRHSDKLKILIALLPDASSGFLKQESAKIKTDRDLNEFVMKLRLEQKYPKRKCTNLPSKTNKRKEPSEPEQINPKYLTLLEMLPDADPDYLMEQSKSLLNDDELQVFILKTVEENSYPKRDQFVERQEYQKQWKRYIENFDIQQYLQVMYNPVKYFYVDKDNSKNHQIPVQFLQHRYRRKNCNEFGVLYSTNKNNLTKTCDQLDAHFRIKPRKYTLWDQKTVFSTAVLQEIAFIQNKKEIAHFMLLRDKLKIIAYEKAKTEGKLLECTCCYEEKLPEDMSSCAGGHKYCLDCIKRGSEVVIGNGGTIFPCYTDDCKEEFSLTVLKSVLNAEAFSRILARKQYAEVNAAGISGLETCSFCEFCSIPPPEDKLFHCLNPSCMKITCRFCKKLDHLPLTCEEFEKKNTQKEMLSYVENKMTEALVRTCWKCGTKFVKESGCNMMTCKCGARMCYFCRQPIKDYSHFSAGRCGEQDTTAHDEAAILNVGKKAKMEMESANPGIQLALDPTELINITRQNRDDRHHHRQHRGHHHRHHHRDHGFLL